METYPVGLLPEVEGEVREAMGWYRERLPGLDAQFYATFLEVLGAVAAAPEAYARVRGDIRRVVFQRFPYALFYVFEGSEIVVVACLHERRSPDRWPNR